MSRVPFSINGQEIAAGSRRSLTLTLDGQSQYTSMAIPVQVIHGRVQGPVMFISAAVHGDEINGIEIIRQLMAHKVLNRLRGTLISVPVVNIYGFFNHTRYLPDRRDLNRAFPGSEHGSLTSRLAHVFRTEIIDRSSLGIDLHTGSNHRTNLPHIRANMSDEDTSRIARAFNAPVIIDTNLRDGSLRQYALEKNIPVLLYEAGESLRFDRRAIKAGVRGVLNVLVAAGMIARSRHKVRHYPAVETGSSHWERAPRSGLFRSFSGLGARVSKGDTLGVIADLMGEGGADITAKSSGIIIGMSQLPTVNEGDAIFHIAQFKNLADADKSVEHFEEQYASPAEGLGEGDYFENI